jgi:hypothetical protein
MFLYILVYTFSFSFFQNSVMTSVMICNLLSCLLAITGMWFSSKDTDFPEWTLCSHSRTLHAPC